ncbi:MAG: biotin--[acetyl-CoA-carboxylase] ligase [Sulfurovum sp.]
MKIHYHKQLPSTQKHIISMLKKDKYIVPFAVITDEQYSGVGSRDNEWSGGEGNFFASFAVDIESLPSDLPLSSASIYFSYIMKQTLSQWDKNILFKWPNDFYIGGDKIGGTITQKIDGVLVCGIGINMKASQNGYRALQSDISAKLLLQNYLDRLEEFPKWKQVFSQFEIEFDSNRKFSVHIENIKTNLKNAILCEDGSLIIDDKKVFSLR